MIHIARVVYEELRCVNFIDQLIRIILQYDERRWEGCPPAGYIYAINEFHAKLYSTEFLQEFSTFFEMDFSNHAAVWTHFQKLKQRPELWRKDYWATDMVEQEGNLLLYVVALRCPTLLARFKENKQLGETWNKERKLWVDPSIVMKWAAMEAMDDLSWSEEEPMSTRTMQVLEKIRSLNAVMNELNFEFRWDLVILQFGRPGYHPQIQLRMLQWAIEERGWKPAKHNGEPTLWESAVLFSKPRLCVDDIESLETFFGVLRKHQGVIYVISWYTLYRCIWDGPDKLPDEFENVLIRNADVFHFSDRSKRSFSEVVTRIFTFQLPRVNFLGVPELEQLLFK